MDVANWKEELQEQADAGSSDPEPGGLDGANLELEAFRRRLEGLL